MTVGDLISIEKRELGKRVVKLCTILCANGESELIPKLEDETFLEEMLEKYQLLEDENA